MLQINISDKQAMSIAIKTSRNFVKLIDAYKSGYISKNKYNLLIDDLTKKSLNTKRIKQIKQSNPHLYFRLMLGNKFLRSLKAK